MVTVTDDAKEELARRSVISSLSSGKYLRLATPPVWAGPGDFGIVIDDRKEEDLVVDLDGSEILLVDESLADKLTDSVFDFKESPDGPRFTLDVY